MDGGSSVKKSVKNVVKDVTEPIKKVTDKAKDTGKSLLKNAIKDSIIPSWGGVSTGKELLKDATNPGKVITNTINDVVPIVTSDALLKGLYNVTVGKNRKNEAKKKAAGLQNYYNMLSQAQDVLSGNLTNLAERYLGGTDNEDLYDDLIQHINDTRNSMNIKDFRKQTWNGIFDSFYNKEQNKYKNNLQDWYNSTFPGIGTTDAYLNNYWTTQDDDVFNKNYLDEYYNNALRQLDTAKSRGLLNDYGYNTARDTLDRRNKAAQGEINTMTDSVLDTYRQDLGSQLAGIQADIDNYSLKNRNTMNSESYTNMVNDLYNKQQNELEANLNNAVSGYTPFIVSDILGNARDTQGIITGGDQNPELLQSLQDRQRKQQNKIGLGNQGIF